MSSTEALGDVIAYLNARESGAAAASANQDRPLHSEGQRIYAEYAGLRLGTLFQPIVAAGPDGVSIAAYEALLAAETVSLFPTSGATLAPQAIFALAHERDDIIALDRLARTLHALNFLVQDRGVDLHLNVDPNHLLAVAADHGQVFEQILRQCGLDPSSIVLEVPAHGVSETERLQCAMASWQSRGYRIALDRFDQPLQLQRLLGLKPDFVKLAPSLLHAATRDTKLQYALAHQLDAIASTGATAIATGIETAAQYELAGRLNIGRLQGFFFGRPAHDCAPLAFDIHEQRRTA